MATKKRSELGKKVTDSDRLFDPVLRYKPKSHSGLALSTKPTVTSQPN